MAEEQQPQIFYKINTSKSYKVYVNTAGGKTYYKVCVEKKHFDGTKVKFYRNLRFVQCEPPKNGDIIKIKKGFEDLYANTKDPYNAISVIVVQDYELENNQIVNQANAYNEYQEKLNENEVEIDDNFLD